MITYEITLKGLTPDQASKVCELVDLINKYAVDNIAVKDSEGVTDCGKTDCIRHDVQDCDTCNICKYSEKSFYRNESSDPIGCRRCDMFHLNEKAVICKSCFGTEGKPNFKLQPGLKNVQ